MTCLAAVCSPQGARAAPLLKIRGHLVLDAQARGNHEGLVLNGRLTDDLGAPVAEGAVAIALRSAAPAPAAGARVSETAAVTCGARPVTAREAVLDATSDEAGRFCVRLPLAAGRFSVAIRADASSDYEGAAIELPFEIGRRTVSLHFDPEVRTASIDATELNLEAVAAFEDDAGGLAAPALTVTLEREDGARLASGDTDASGRARLRVDATKLGAPGPGMLRLRYAGNASNADCMHTASFNRSARVTLAPAELVVGGAPEDGIAIPIIANTKAGPVMSGSIEATIGDRSVGAAPVRSGRADLLVSFPAHSAGDVPLRVRYAPDTPWVLGGDPLLINVPVHAPVPTRQWPLLGGAALLAVWLIAGRLRSARRSAAAHTATLRGSAQASSGVAEIAIVRALTQSDQHRSLAGTVIDAHDRSPVAGAHVSVEQREMTEVRVVVAGVTGADGRFELQLAALSGPADLVAEGALHASLRLPLPRAQTVEIALVLRKRRMVDELVRWARRRGAPFDATPDATPGHVRAAGGEREPDVAAWAEAVENAAFSDAAIDAEAEARIALATPNRGATSGDPRNAR